ncbi:hypothetical protein CN514_05605 [Bacillus sp. AFS001701]|uniref:hypothetical protein n=1 Tax=Bacillus sp. AFS001701 TaxID=2033480 RepID=UPI000BF60B24|nr:hypothetical protein [Bacillus sp. AFS001701]PET71853.1 hypothetical protein CN514_05605 [Bacillus sp. AFS001701]
MDLTELDERIRKLEEDLVKLVKERTSKGLPAERPPSFVSMELTEKLMERVWPLRDLIVKYASLLAASGTILELDVKKLRDKYSDDLTLLNESVGMLCGMTGYMLLDCLDKIEKAQLSEDAEASDLMRDLYTNIGLCEKRPLIVEEVPEVFDDEELARAHYEKIKHLI